MQESSPMPAEPDRRRPCQQRPAPVDERQGATVFIVRCGNLRSFLGRFAAELRASVPGGGELWSRRRDCGSRHTRRCASAGLGIGRGRHAAGPLGSPGMQPEACRGCEVPAQPVTRKRNARQADLNMQLPGAKVDGFCSRQSGFNERTHLVRPHLARKRAPPQWRQAALRPLWRLVLDFLLERLPDGFEPHEALFVRRHRARRSWDR